MNRFPLRLCVFAFALMALMPAGYAIAACTPTASIANQNYPGGRNIPNGNNLMLPAGKSMSAQGQQLIINGQLFDRNCVPVPQATIELWQVDPYGRWLLAGPDDLATPNPVFAGAGRTYTDTNGSFSFVTAFPSGAAKRAPNLNLRVIVDGMPNFNTVLYFADDSRNEGDTLYHKLSAAARESVTLHMGQSGSDLIGTIALVLPGKARYQTY